MSRFSPRSVLSAALALLAALIACTPARAVDEALNFHGASLETYLGSGASTAHDLIPLAQQRGTGRDGTTRLRPTMPWVLGPNPV